MTKALLSLLLLAVALTVSADPLEEGVAAVGRGDYAAAFKAFKPLAEAGNVAAQVNLGNLYMKGVGVQQNYVEAGRWYTHAAEQNERIAQSKLGVLHYYGLGTEKNPQEAARWFAKAAQQGERSAQAVLGSLYAQGDGVPKDYAQAYYWYSMAAQQGSEDADIARKGLVEEMAPGQMDEAMRLLGEARRKAADEAEHELDSALMQATPAPDTAAAEAGGKAPHSKRKRAERP